MGITNRGETAVAGYSVPIGPGSSGSAVLNIYGEVVGILHSYYPKFDNIGLGASHRQLQKLFEKADEVWEQRKESMLDRLEPWL